MKKKGWQVFTFICNRASLCMSNVRLCVAVFYNRRYVAGPASTRPASEPGGARNPRTGTGPGQLQDTSTNGLPRRLGNWLSLAENKGDLI